MAQHLRVLQANDWCAARPLTPAPPASLTDFSTCCPPTLTPSFTSLSLFAFHRDSSLVEEYAAFWKDEVLLPSDTLAAAGVAYHISDLLLQELSGVVAQPGAAPAATTLETLLEPYCAALAATRDAVLVRRLRQGLFDAVAEGVGEPGETDALRHLDAVALSERLFNLGEYNHPLQSVSYPHPGANYLPVTPPCGGAS